ncbi:MAG: AAA family ATPase [Candidatus Saccharibacteria bacterium]
MQRISVIGCPGAGKTRFCRDLSAALELPLIHLDRLYHDTHFDYKDNKDAWRAAVQELVAGDTWIIDGNYKSTFDIRMPASDTIIFLDYPTYVSAWRAVKRRIKLHGKLRPDMPANWRESLGWNFFTFILMFNRVDARRIRAMLQNYNQTKNVVILRSPRRGRAFLTQRAV